MSWFCPDVSTPQTTETYRYSPMAQAYKRLTSTYTQNAPTQKNMIVSTNSYHPIKQKQQQQKQQKYQIYYNEKHNPRERFDYDHLPRKDLAAVSRAVTVDKPNFSNNYSNQLTYYEPHSRLGIPNIGNTCYMNSALQLLFTASDFQNKILKTQTKKKELNYQIYKIFENIKLENMNCNNQRKREIVEKIQDLVSTGDSRFAQYRQADSLEFIIRVLNILSAQLPHLQLIEMFTKKTTLTYYCIRCKWTNSCTIEEIYHIQHTDETKCPSCSRICQIKSQTKSAPKYMLSTYEIKENPGYTPKAKIFHTGNHYSGHYYIQCLRNGQWYRISDSIVDKITEKKKSRHAEMRLVLYERHEDHNFYRSPVNIYQSHIDVQDRSPKAKKKLASKTVEVPLKFGRVSKTPIFVKYSLKSCEELKILSPHLYHPNIDPITKIVASWQPQRDFKTTQAAEAYLLKIFDNYDQSYVKNEEAQEEWEKSFISFIRTFNSMISYQ